MVDLNTLISSKSGFSVVLVRNINDLGEITGRGAPRGGDNSDVCGHDYLLIPCDENHPNAEGCDYSLVDAGGAVREIAAPTMP